MPGDGDAAMPRGAAGVEGAERRSRLPGFTLEAVLWAVVALGVLLRVASVWSGHMFWDSAYQVEMARGFAGGNNFVLPWGDPFTPVEPGYVAGPSHHFSPLFSMYLGAFYAAFGYSMTATRVAVALLSVLCLAAIYYSSRDLLGRDKALVVTAVLAMDPMMLVSTRDLMPETMVVAFFVLTMWAIVRGIKDDRYMLIAALCAGGGYLSKSSVGTLFIVAGAGGFLWRFAYIRWDVFKRRYYLAAIAVFLSIVGAWSMRNILTFGWPNWQTSPYLESALRHGLSNIGEFAVALAVTVPFFAAILLTYGGYWLPWARRSLAGIRHERTSALWLSVGLVLVISLWFSASLAMYEDWDLLTHSADRMRYLVLAFPPLLWAVMYEVDLGPLDKRLGARMLWTTLKEMGRVIMGLPRRRQRTLCIAGLAASSPLLLLAGWEYMFVAWSLLGAAASLLLVDPRKVLVVMLVFLLVPTIERATQRTENPYIDLAEDLSPMLSADSVVAFDGSDNEMGYLYIGLEDLDFTMERWANGSGADYVLSTDLDRTYTNYTLVRTYDLVNHPGVVIATLQWISGIEAREPTPVISLWSRDQG